MWIKYIPFLVLCKKVGKRNCQICIQTASVPTFSLINIRNYLSNVWNKSSFSGDVVCQSYDIHNALSIINTWLFRSVDSCRYLHALTGTESRFINRIWSRSLCNLRCRFRCGINARALYVGRANTHGSKSIQECRRSIRFFIAMHRPTALPTQVDAFAIAHARKARVWATR